MVGFEALPSDEQGSQPWLMILHEGLCYLFGTFEYGATINEAVDGIPRSLLQWC